MKLSAPKIDEWVRQLTAALAHSEGIRLVDDRKAAGYIRKVLTENLKAEDELEEQVRALLRLHANKINAEDLNYDVLFQRAKKQMAREKGFIL